MPNKITYTIKTSDGKEHQVSKENIDKHGIQAYADAYEGATIRMRDSKKGDYDIPLANYNDAKAQGLHAFSWEHLPPKAQPQAKQQVAQKQSTQQVATTAPGAPMTAAQKAQVLNNANNIIAQSQSDLSRTMRKFDYAKQNTGLDVKPIKLGENRNVATKKNKNGQTTYLDAEGNRFDDHAQANFSQTQIEEDEAKRKDLLGYIDKKAMSSVNSAYDKQYSELEDFKKKHPYLSAFSRALSAFSGRMSGGGTANINQYRPEEARAGLAALALNQKTRQAIDEGKRYEQGDTGFWGRATRGLKKGLTSASTYDLGLSDTDIAGSLKGAADRYAKGQATQMDELLLDAAALNSETEGKYADALGGWFGAGEGIPGVASFMMQIGSNPMSGFGKATAQSVAKTVTKRAVQKFGTGLAAKAAITLAKGATRVAADAVEAGVVTAMYSPTKIVGDYLNRKTGTVVHDGNGGYTFEGKEYSDIKAVAKAINDQNAENLSEMWGDYLPGIGKVGKLIGKGARKIGLGKVVNAFEQMSSSQWMKTWNEFMDRTKWNGLLGEYMEEAEKNLYNALTNGDMTLDTNPNTGVFSRKINEDTFKSVALMSGIMSGISTVGYTRFKYKASRGQKKADNNAKAVLGAEKWSEIKNLIDNADDKSIGGILEQIGNDNSLNTKQKMAILDYQYKSAVAHGANIQDLKNKLEGNYDEKANRYDAGYNATEDELANIKNELELRHRQLTETFKDDPSALQQIEEDPKAFLQGLKESEVGGEKAKVINAYEETRAAYDGMIQRVKDNIDDAITENNNVIEQRTHQDGNIYPATMKLDDRKVYVVGGNVQMNEDGKGIDHEKSSSSVMIRDAETGKIEMVDPSAILSVDTPVNAEEEKATSSEQIKQTYAQEQANKIDGVLEFKAGDTYSILGEDKKQHTIQIVGEAIDEKTKQPNPDMVMASIDGLEPTMLSKEQIQAMNNEENLWRLDQSLKQGEEVENTTPHSKQSYGYQKKITLTNGNGNLVRGEIVSGQNEDGRFEVQTEEPVNGKTVNHLTAEELDAMHAQIQEEQEESPALVAENATTQKEDVSGVNDGTIAENATVQKEETPQRQSTALERIPTNEQGEPIYEQADPETAWDAIVEQTEGDESIAQSVADGMVADMEAAVKRAEKAKVKGGTTIAEKIAAEKERVATIEQAKATLEHWKKIASTNSRRQEAIQAEENRKAKEAALLRKEQEEKERDKREEAQPQTLDYKLSDEVDENGHPFVLTSARELAFGNIGKETGLAPAPILLSEGVITNSKTNAGYGLVHIEARHGEQIRNAGYPSVVAFVEEVAKHYDVIREGINRSGEQTYMLQLTDRHNNTLMVELSGDGTYYNINTAGIFKTSYGKNRREVYNRHTTDNQSTESGEESQGEAQSGTTSPSRMKSSTRSSAGKVSESSNAMQGNAEKTSENEATIVETNPTEAQKEAGNYKKGHIKVDGMNITIEQPKGSIRRGKDASGKEWESEMHNTYGYIRGTEGVDGDHIDIFLSDNPNEGNVFVVDQVNKDGSFDEHKVMYGFADKESARQAYLSNYEDGWQGLGNITEVSKEEFKKWIGSSKRKTKPFAEYKGIIKSNKSVSSPVAMSEDEYLTSKGLNGNMTDYMLDKLRIPHSETARQQKQREKEAARVRADFDNQKEEARKEYRQKIAKGELREPTKQEAKEREIAKLIKTANGHEDNPSVQAARRVLAKRGVDWRTDKGDMSDNDLAYKKELEDFVASTDSNNRTKIDESKYDAEDLFAPLLLDGKSSNLAVMTLISDYIYDPIRQIAVYDYSFDIDNKTNSGWQKWGDLADEYNAHAVEVDKAWGENDNAMLEFRTVDAAVKFNDWLKAKEDGKSNVVHSFGNSASQNDTSIKLSDTSFAKMENGEQKAEEEIGWLVDHNIRLKENSRKLDEIAHLLFDGDNIDSNRESALREEAKKILEENEKLSRDYQKNYSDKYFGTDDITANYILQEANERLIALGVKPVKESYYFQSRKNEIAQNAVVQLLKRIGIPVHVISRVGAEVSGQGNSRGWTNGLDIWLTKDNINAETPVHEYTHIWTFALMKKNPKLWAEIKNLLKDSEWVDAIQSMDEYKYTLDNEDLLYSEVLSRISGERNGEKFESMAFKLIEEVNSVEKKVDLKRGLEKLRDALKRFWEWVGVNLFGMKEFKSVDDVCDRVLFDLLNASDIARTEEMREYYEEEREMNTIIDKAKEDGTYLKTPSGEDSKLPEKVWAYARTKKFKTQLSDRLNLILNESKEDFKDWEKEEFRDLFKKHDLLEENNEPGRFLVSQFMYSEKYYDRKGKMQEEAKETMNSGKGGENVSSVKSVDLTEEAKTFNEDNDDIRYRYEEGEYPFVDLRKDHTSSKDIIKRGRKTGNIYFSRYSPARVRTALIKRLGEMGIKYDVNNAVTTNSSYVNFVANGVKFDVRLATHTKISDTYDNTKALDFKFEDGKINDVALDSSAYGFKTEEILNIIDEVKRFNELDYKPNDDITKVPSNDKQIDWYDYPYIGETLFEKVNESVLRQREGEYRELQLQEERKTKERMKTFMGTFYPFTTSDGAQVVIGKLDGKRLVYKDGVRLKRSTDGYALDEALKEADNTIDETRRQFELEEKKQLPFEEWQMQTYGNVVSNVFKVDNESNSSKDKEAKTFAKQHNLDASDIIAYKQAMDEGHDSVALQVKQPIEQSKNLVALHNLSEEKLQQALELGGFPMPSIAITKANIGHTEFGNISLLFGKDSINPTDKRNKVYGGDAWTPTFPSIGYKLNSEKTSDIYRRANNVGSLPLFRPVFFHPDNYENKIDGQGSNGLVEHFKDDYGAKQMFLYEKGNAVEKFVQHEVEKYSDENVKFFKKILETIGLERLKNEGYDSLENEMKKLLGQYYDIDFDTMKPFRVKTRINSTIQKTIDYAENGNNKIENDIAATEEKIDERIDPKEFRKWLEKLFSGVVEKKGIRNEQDMFTPSGNRREWEKLYDAVTLDNAIKAMQTQAKKGGTGLFGGSIFGAASKELKEIEDIRNEAKLRINPISEEDYQAEKDRITERLKKVTIPSVSKSFSDAMDFVENVQDAVSKSHTAKGIYRHLHSLYPDMTMEVAKEIEDIVKDIQKISTRYLEAKPYRAVSFDEIKAAVVPSDTSSELIQQLKDRGIEVSTYEKDNQEQRKQIVNEVASKEELLFRNDDGIDVVNERFNEELDNLTEENADKVTLWLGKPSDVLLSSGIENKPLKLYGNKVIKKMKKHGFALDELRDLPKAVADPIAVFDNLGRFGNRSILTELTTEQGNFLVTIDMGKGEKDVDFNIVSSVFGKGKSKIVSWIERGLATYINKKKALNYLHHSAPIAEALSNSRLSSAANIVKNFENPTNSSEKVLDRKTTQAEEVAEKERQQMVERANELAETLHLDNVEIVTDARTLEGKKAKAKGFYSTSTGKITIVIPNHSNIADVEKTLLHEAVAHHGLRKLFGEHFDNFLDNVFKNASEDVRREIVKLAAKNKWDFRIATEEYLASLAEDTNFENMPNGLWDKVKRLFLDMLRSIGLLKQKDGEWNDNELRYILWRSYKNLKEKGQSNSILNKAEDIAMQHRLKVGNYSESTDKEVRFRDGEPQSKERVSAAERYEQRVSRSMFQSQEALQDSMLGLKEAMDAIMRAEGKEMYMEDIEGFENAYLGENRLSSVNQAETEAFAHLVFKPMLDEVAKLAKNDKERSELTDYMMAKHGLERNEVMRKNALEEIINNEKLSDAQKDARASIAEHRDYAGLTALTDANSVEEAESEARRMVEEYEQKHDTTNLWDKVNTVTKGILSKSYECGMMNKQTYEKVRDMYQFYIPLRGFDEETSREAYAYLSHGQSAFNAPIKTAKGRSSKADDPFANMQSMAENAIMQGNRNVLVKQKFLNFALNHPSDLVSVNALWLKYDDVKEEWRPVFPDNIEETDTADEVEKKIQDFEQRMAELAKQDPERYKHGKDTENIPYRIVESRDLRQHQVVVKRNGRDYVLTINGNPRAAQALNGLTNPDNDVSGAIGAILNFGEKINRQLSAFYTTRNPDFVISNFIRDMLYANSIVWVKERPNYALRFHRNIGRCNPAQMKILLSKHKKGELDMNNSLEHMFHQFIMNGGETGYANVRDIEQHKNDIQRELKRANGKIGIKRSLSLLGEKLDEYNRAVENCARFAAFLTSREMGRTIDRSIYDAKDISVNFNKKGSGAKFMKATGQTKIGKTSAFISGIGRSGYVFWNAAIQGTTNFGRQFKRHPAKAFTASATMFILGALIAGMGMGDDGDDDKNSYWNLPESVRRSNILFRVGEQWVSIPLPVEYRSIYGMGELMVSAMSGKEHFTNSELGKAIAGQVTQILPIDFLEGEGGVKAFVPSAVKPFAEVISNKGWTGMPIYKDTPYNKNMPEWTKTYKSANKYLVGLAKTLNEVTGGDAYTKGSVNINPAQIEYLLNGYFGGVSNTIDKLTKSAETIAGKRDYDPKSFLLLNRVLKSGDERTEERAINREYYRLKEEYEILRDRLKNYENDTDNGVFDFSEKINFLYNSPEYARYEIFEDYRGDIESLYKELKDPMSDEERASIEAELTGLKKQMIEEMNATRK